MPLHLIVNASTMHKSSSNPIADSLWEFAFLRFLCANAKSEKATSSLLANKNSLSVRLKTSTYFFETFKLYKSKEMLALIDQYKLGRLDSTQFLNRLLETHFPELKEINFPDSIEKESAGSLSLYSSRQEAKEIENLSSSHRVALTLLEKAWGVRIQPFDKTYMKRVEKLVIELQQPEVKALRIISNSNPIDMHRLLMFLHDEYKDTFCHPSKIEYSNTNPELKIGAVSGKPIILAVSYRFGAFKDAETTSGLVETIVTQFLSKTPRKSIKLISHWNRDCITGKRLGLNVRKANQYFSPINPQARYLLWACVLLSAAISFKTSPSNAFCLFALGLCGPLFNKYGYDFEPNIRSVASGLAVGSLLGQAGLLAASALPTLTDSASNAQVTSLTNN